jgi:hypothetical protein
VQVIHILDVEYVHEPVEPPRQRRLEAQKEFGLAQTDAAEARWVSPEPTLLKP